MAVKRKRGQFFLIAALVIIVVVFSFGVVSNSARTSNFDSGKLNAVAKDIKYESVQLINQGVYNNFTSAVIYFDLQNITSSYSEFYPQYNISIIYGNSYDSVFNAATYSSGTSYNLDLTTDPVLGVSLNNVPYSFNITKGYNFYVIVSANQDGETYISAE